MPVARLASTLVAFLLWVATLSPITLRAEVPLPILRAHSRQVDVQDGGHLMKGVWTVDPRVPLDVYEAQRSAEPRQVTFITDQESMSFDVQPGRTYDFIIQLDGKEACRTRISARTQPFQRTEKAPATGPVTVPLTITRGKLHLKGRFNDSAELDLLFDTGADIQVLYPSALKKGVRLQLDGSQNNLGSGGQTMRQTSSDNRVDISGLRWEHEPVLFIEKQADQADGIIGFTLFQDKVVELDFDQMVMTIHEALPLHASGFARTAMPYSGTLTAVMTGFGLGGRQEVGPLLLDTGGNGTLTVNSAFASDHGLPGPLQNIGTSELRGVGPNTIRADLVKLPELTLAGHTLWNVPISVELPGQGEAAPPGGALFLDVLSRFNLILDYPRNQAYFKPNSRFDAPFKVRSSRLPRYAKGLLALAVLASLTGLMLYFTWRRRTATPGTAT